MIQKLYVWVQETARVKVTTTKPLDSQRIVDYDEHGEIVGIEFLAVHQGVDLSELPHRHELEKLFEDHDIPLYA